MLPLPLRDDEKVGVGKKKKTERRGMKGRVDEGMLALRGGTCLPEGAAWVGKRQRECHRNARLEDGGAARATI